MLLSFIVGRQTLPKGQRKEIEQYIPVKTVDSQLEVDLFEVEDLAGINMKTRYCLIFKSSQEVTQFYEDWNNSTTRKAQIDQYIQIKNMLLIFLRMQVRIGILGKQCIDMRIKPIYILGFQQTFRQIQPYLNRSNAYFKIQWLKSRQGSPFRNRDEESEQSLSKSRSRSQSKSKSKKQNNCIKKKSKFRDLNTDTMIEQLETCGEALIQQIDELENYFTGFYNLVKQTVAKVDNEQQFD